MIPRNKPKKKKFLPYKNLGELYTEAVQGEPSINRLPIVETGAVLITRDNGAEDILRQNVSDNILDKIDIILNEKELEDRIDKAIISQFQFAKRPESKSYLALAASLREAIKTSGGVEEIEEFCSAYREGTEFINIEALTTSTDTPQDIKNFINKFEFIPNSFAQNVFKYLFLNLPAGKSDAGPGEGALVALSPNISYANKGDVYIKEYGIVEVKAARELGGRGGRVWDSVVDQRGMVIALRKIFPQRLDEWSVRVYPGQTKTINFVKEIINNDPDKTFIKAACNAWFGALHSDVVDNFKIDINNNFDAKQFASIWHKHIFNTYKDRKNFNGLLSLGRTKYHYVTTPEEFIEMKFSDSGYICNTVSNQDRDLAPQLKIF